jgi:hypothetical protein
MKYSVLSTKYEVLAVDAVHIGDRNTAEFPWSSATLEDGRRGATNSCTQTSAKTGVFWRQYKWNCVNHKNIRNDILDKP